MHQLNLGSEPYLKDFLRAGVLQSKRLTGINQEKVDEVNDFLQTHPGSKMFGLLSNPLRYQKRQQHIELSLNIYY